MKPGHQVLLLQGGAAFFPALIAAIDNSVLEVRMETYIFHFDVSGERVAEALVRAARRSVAVYLVMDGVGTPEVPSGWAQRFTEAGVHWHRFSPLGGLGFLLPVRWRRLHRKLCVVDACVVFCGGINILDDFVDPHYGPQTSPRFDFAVQVRGPLVADAHRATNQFWRRVQTTRQLEHLQLGGAHEFLKESIKPLCVPGPVAHGTSAPADVGALAALVLRDNVRNRARIERAYRKAIGEARQEVLIANAYFLPGGKLRRALIHAARRGVRVRLLLHGRYEYFMQYHAARPVLGALLAAGVEIHEYTLGFLHAKVAVVDGRWATVGSSNLDPLSLLLAREANVVVEDVPFAQTLRAQLTQAIESQGVRLDPSLYALRPWQQRCLDRLAYGLMRLGLFLTGRRY
ncbi:MAG: cardiolipin synthase ClsB [Rhodoferax sp.]|nr:cardiolipin synthase ClsB [Rhodoferax sp.]MDP3652602.1 cardiolipin synthase ClsB [Rhodoferax sp.]